MDFVIASFGVAYLTYVLVLDSSKLSAGPLVFKNPPSIFFEETGACRVFGLFDAFRFLTGAYKKQGGVYVPTKIVGALWSCRWCLSFWVSLVFVFLFQHPFLMLFSIAGAANILMTAYELQMQAN